VRKAKDKEISFAPEGQGKAPRRRRTETPAPQTAPKSQAPKSQAPKSHRPRSNGPQTARPARATRPKAVLPEDMLRRALEAPTPRSRALWARRGLASRAALDRTTQAMLLRQLYLAYYEEERFEEATVVSEQALRLDVLPDVAHQDAARAKQALGDIDGAAAHLRLAARLGPPNRKAFHYWTLGSLFYLEKRYEEAASAMSRAARWGTTDKPLYQGHLALSRLALGEAIPELDAIIERLEEAPSGKGYGQFVLGMLALHAGRRGKARRFLEAFVERTTGGRRAGAIALRGEIEAAREALAHLPAP